MQSGLDVRVHGRMSAKNIGPNKAGFGVVTY
jgi:hypothetical protein